MISYSKIPTENLSSSVQVLDDLSVRKMIAVMNLENEKISRAIAKQSGNIEKAISLIETSYKAGHKIFFVGAGTSGRLGVLEASELSPTFGVASNRFQAVMAGGNSAVFRSKEGSEDGTAEIRQLLNKKLRPGDVVIGIAASGVTAFVQSALRTAKQRRALTILLTCNPSSALIGKTDVSIALDTGPEIISGSTRLKAGSATKMVLNTLTTLAMVRCGKTYKNRMVDVQVNSRKLKERALRLVQELGRVSSRSEAEKILKAAHGNAKTAILMAREKISYVEAFRKLNRCNGFLAKSFS